MTDPVHDALVRALGVQYDIGRVIGRGGMGTVYAGREKALERDVAIKVLPPEAAEASADGRERFRREARIAAQLTHSNIVPLHTFGETEGLTFFVMGFVRGESLGARLRRDGRLAPDVARRILSELADALGYAHRKGVVHRDIKPDNVLIEDDSGRAMLTDFGIAKGHTSAGSLTQTGMVVGTPTYMSPEQATGDRNVDGRSDLYALGVLGYEMLAGRAVFRGESAQQLLMQHATQAPTPLAALAPEAPAGLAAAIMRCLEKDPAHRFPDGKSLGAVLDGPDDADELISDHLRGIRSLVPLSLINAYVAALVELGFAVSPMLPEMKRLALPWAGLVALFAIVGGGLIAGTLAHVRGKHSWNEIWRYARLAPRWWIFAWPRRWSPPGVEHRVPKNIKRWRASFQVMFYVIAGVGIPAWVAGAFGPVAWSKPLLATGLFTMAAGAVPMFVCMGIAQFWGKKRGLTDVESAWLLNAPYTSPVWKRPNIAALLIPESTPAPAAGEPNSPHDLLRAIGALAPQIGAAFRHLADDAGAAAREAINEIDALDREIAALAGEVNAAEERRLAERLSALASDSPLRPLLTNQLELLQSLAKRVDGLTQRRERVVDMVRTLWLQLANLRALQSADTSQASAITGRIRALCVSVAHEISADREVAALLRRTE